RRHWVGVTSGVTGSVSQAASLGRCHKRQTWPIELCKGHSRISTSWKEYLEATVKLNLKVNDNPRFVTYTNPGLNYFYNYDRDGSPDLVRLLLHAFNAEIFAGRLSKSTRRWRDV
ncbi:hypothetical protein Bpfe_022466, partial [Biomphalaria pfeifferi]